MKDKWLNTSFEDNILQPFKEDLPNYNDPERIREFSFHVSFLLFPQCTSFLLSSHATREFRFFVMRTYFRVNLIWGSSRGEESPSILGIGDHFPYFLQPICDFSDSEHFMTLYGNNHLFF